MSLKSNIIANYASQIYATLIGIVMVPVYLRYMGPEAYGLVGFFGVLQGVLQLMDMGLSGTLSREVTCYRAGALAEDRLNALLRALVAVFICVGLSMAALVWLASGWIAGSWLQARALSPVLLAQCISLMGVAAALRWVAGLYRGILNGMEQQVWLGGYNSAIATARYVGVLAAFFWIGVDPFTFFTFQALVALAELVILWFKASKILPGVKSRPSLEIGPLKAMWHFSGALAFTSMVWLCITQTDKLVLSKTLTLADYGYFTLAVMVANGVNTVSTPISSALLPRLTFLVSQRDEAAVRNLYGDATQWVSVVVWPIASMVAFFAEPLLQVWTKDPMIAHRVAPVLFWYALGNACLGVAAFQYYLQFAYGKLRLHVIGNVLFVVLLIPGIVWASVNYGALGAGRVWFAENLLFFLSWTWIVHSRFLPGLHFRWLCRDVLPTAVTSLAMSWMLSNVAKCPADRFSGAALLVGLGTVSFLATCLASTSVRSTLRTTRMFT